MIYGIVKGTVTASVKNPHFENMKLMVIQPLDLENKPNGACILASDAVQSGPGDYVIVVREGGSANKVFGYQFAPLQSVIVGIVDEIQLEESLL